MAPGSCWPGKRGMLAGHRTTAGCLPPNCEDGWPAPAAHGGLSGRAVSAPGRAVSTDARALPVLAPWSVFSGAFFGDPVPGAEQPDGSHQADAADEVAQSGPGQCPRPVGPGVAGLAAEQPGEH